MAYSQELRLRLIAAVASSFGLITACGAKSENAGQAHDSTGAESAPQPNESPGSLPSATGTAPPPGEELVPGPVATNMTSGEPGAMTPVAPPDEPELPQCEFGIRYELCLDRAMMESMFRVGVGDVAKRPVPTADQIQAAFLPNGCLPQADVANSCCNPAIDEGTRKGDDCCYHICQGPCCGRPLYVSGEVIVAPAVLRDDWVGKELATAVISDASIAAEWRRDAQMEHASIAAFSSFTLSLLAVGAPADLVRAAQAAAADEIRHAEQTFAIASQFAGESTGPGLLAVSGLEFETSLRRLAIATFRDGCIGEAVAAATARAQAEVCSDDSIRSTLFQIAEDETQHSELAWRFLAWALQKDPSIGAELRDVMVRVARGWSDITADCPDLAAWYRAGRLTRSERLALAEEVIGKVVRPTLERLLGLASAAPDRRRAASAAASIGLV